MSRKRKNDKAVDPSLPQIPPELLSQLVSGPMTAEGLEAMFRQLKKALIERAMEAKAYAPPWLCIRRRAPERAEQPAQRQQLKGDPDRRGTAHARYSP
jgi:putative transposase